MAIFLIAVFFIWRIWLFLSAWLGEQLLTFAPRFPYADVYLIPSGLPSWLWSFANFDGVHYLTIARSGYSAQFTQVFFPLYPLLLGVFSRLLPFVNNILLFRIVTDLIFLVTLFVFYRMLKIDYQIREIHSVLVFLLFFPMSFFFGSLYTESLFMLLVFLSFYFGRMKKWWLAGLFGGLASATRLTGIFLLPALIFEKYLVFKIENKQSKRKITNYQLLIINLLTLCLIPLGLLLYMFYLQFAFGDWLYFWHVQPVFGAQRSGGGIILLPQVIWRYLKILTTIPISQEAFWIPLTEIISLVLAVTSLIYAHLKKVRLSYFIFSWPAVILPTLTGTLSSMPRYIMVAFPIYMVLGLMRNKWLKIFILAVFIVLLSVFTILFTRGHWVS